MALFTDGTISTLDDLRSYENAIFDVAASERIDLSRKLLLAQQEVEVDLTDLLLQEGPAGRPDLRRVVVTLALRQWHTFHTLALAYRDAYSSHLNDRYRGKWAEYERLGRWASSRCFDTGVGMVDEPIAKAPSPTLSTAAGSIAGATYWVRGAWINVRGNEGCPSEPAILSTDNGFRLVAELKDVPAGVTGWNVYAGYSNDVARLQNTTPLAAGTAWQMPDTELAAGPKAGEGQQPSYFVVRRRLLQRG